MNFEITKELIDTINPYTENVTVKISTDNKDWKGRDYKSDFVTKKIMLVLRFLIMR